MTRTKVLNKIPFDYVDSSTWLQGAAYGRVSVFKNGKMASKEVKGRYTTEELKLYGLEAYMQLAEYYNAKWSKVNHDLYIGLWFEISHKIKLWRKVLNEIKNKRCSQYRNYWSFICGYIISVSTIQLWSNSIQTC